MESIKKRSKFSTYVSMKYMIKKEGFAHNFLSGRVCGKTQMTSCQMIRSTYN